MIQTVEYISLLIIPLFILFTVLYGTVQEGQGLRLVRRRGQRRPGDYPENFPLSSHHLRRHQGVPGIRRFRLRAECLLQRVCISGHPDRSRLHGDRQAALRKRLDRALYRHRHNHRRRLHGHPHVGHHHGQRRNHFLRAGRLPWRRQYQENPLSCAGLPGCGFVGIVVAVVVQSGFSDVQGSRDHQF